MVETKFLILNLIENLRLDREYSPSEKQSETHGP